MTTSDSSKSQRPPDTAGALSDRAWELLEKANRTAEETGEMLRVAQAAANEWRGGGRPLDAQRAENLLATAYVKAGQAEPALEHAQRGLELSERNGADQSPLDRAITLAAAAKAHNLVWNGEEALRLILLAIAEADKLAEEERSTFDRLFGEG